MSQSLAEKSRRIGGNYFYLTVAQASNAFIYLLVYPLVIKRVGFESYGAFVFASSIAAYFTVFVMWGFDLYGTNIVAGHPEDRQLHASLFVAITGAKLVLLLLSILPFIAIIAFINVNGADVLLYWACYLNVIAVAILPAWYFYGAQKVKELSIVQLGIKIVSLVPIVVFVQGRQNVVLYAIILTVANVISAGILAILAVRFIGLPLPRASITEALHHLGSARRLFLYSAINVVKQKSVEIVLGVKFGMREVALFDLANKIYSVPSLFAANINAAIFPMYVSDRKSYDLKKIIKYEAIVGVMFMCFIAIMGWPIAVLIAKENWALVHRLAILLSVGVMTQLIVGAHIYLIFTPSNRHDLIVENQLVALAALIIFATMLLQVNIGVYAIGYALAGAAIMELLYSMRQVSRLNSDREHMRM